MILGTLEGCKILAHDAVIEYTAKAAIDSDGSDNRHHDGCWQPDTSLHYKGKAIDAESVPYIVVPPLIIQGVVPVVLGCNAIVENTLNGKKCVAVVADIGPSAKLGEMSCECARRLGLSGNPNTGGTDDHVIHYTLYPGVPATVDGITYVLQPRRSKA